MLCKLYAIFMQTLCKLYARMKSSKSEKYQRKATYPIRSWLAWRRRQRPQSAADVVPAKFLREYKCPVPGVRVWPRRWLRRWLRKCATVLDRNLNLWET